MTPATRTRNIILKACPRCLGDLFHDDDEGVFTCLQCGRMVAAEKVMATARIDNVLDMAMTPETWRRLWLVPRQETTHDAA